MEKELLEEGPDAIIYLESLISNIETKYQIGKHKVIMAYMDSS